MSKNIGDQVTLNGKAYTIAGFYKRSYLLTDARGKQYKCGPEKLDRMEAGRPPKRRDQYSYRGTPPVTVAAAKQYFEREIEYAGIFKIDLRMPDAHNVQGWLDRIDNAMSPENLHCDGEISRSRAMAKLRVLEIAQAYCLTLQATNKYADQVSI